MRCTESFKDNYCVLGAQNFFKIATTLEPGNVAVTGVEVNPSRVSSERANASKVQSSSVESGKSLVSAFHDVAFCSCRYIYSHML